MRYTAVLALLALPLCAFAQKLENVPNPASPGAIQPNWTTAPDGGVVLSWIEPAQGGAYSLKYAVRHGSTWSEGRTVVAQRRFFRQPAEAPEVMQVNDHLWMAHWIEMPKQEAEAEFVYVSSSTDGVKWTTPLMAHKDTSMVQHGLASMIASGTGEISIFWLFTPKGEDGPAYLMRTVVDPTGKEIKEERLDPDVCTCCPTAVVKTAKGLLVAYRDHAAGDIRDISVLRFENGKWTEPKNIYPDKWEINACPTNAAAVASKGNHVAIAWYTESQDKPKVQLVFSEDGGVTFSKPAVVSTGDALGYTSIAMDDDGSVLVSWLEQDDKNDTHVLLRPASAMGKLGAVVHVAQGGRQALGYPRLSHSAAGNFIAWGGQKLQTAALKK